jgi:hypothetical protein
VARILLGLRNSRFHMHLPELTARHGGVRKGTFPDGRMRKRKASSCAVAARAVTIALVEAPAPRWIG